MSSRIRGAHSKNETAGFQPQTFLSCSTYWYNKNPHKELQFLNCGLDDWFRLFWMRPRISLLWNTCSQYTSGFMTNKMKASERAIVRPNAFQIVVSVHQKVHMAVFQLGYYQSLCKRLPWLIHIWKKKMLYIWPRISVHRWKLLFWSIMFILLNFSFSEQYVKFIQWKIEVIIIMSIKWNMSKKGSCCNDLKAGRHANMQETCLNQLQIMP